MKKQFFRMATTLSLIAGLFAFNGCTDYEEDINAINDRIDNLETGQIADIDKQLENLATAISDAEGLISTLRTDVTALQDADKSLQGLIDGLDGEIENVNKQISEINTSISNLETDLEKQINDAVSELEQKDNALSEDITKVANDLTAAQEALSDEIAKGDAANASKIDELSKKIDENYSTLEKLISDANASNAEEFKKLNDELTEQKGKLDEAITDIANLVSDVADLTGRVAELEKLPDEIDALEETVKNIQNDYLTKEEAADTYATIEAVKALETSIGEIQSALEKADQELSARITALEGKYDSDLKISEIVEKINKAQTAADNAADAAEKAQESADKVLGDLNTLKEALGVYAEKGKLEGDIKGLQAKDEELSKQADAIKDMIGELEEGTTVAGELTALWNKIGEIDGTVADAIADLENTKLDIENFDDEFNKQLDAALADGGKITEAIATAITKLSGEIDTKIDDVNNKIDEINKTIEGLPEWKTAVDDAIDGLENRIQSLVYVPEYSDGKAAVYLYRINEVPVSENVVATATFKVTPAALADAVVNQYKDNVVVNVVPVKSVSTRAAEKGTVISGENLVVSKNASDPSYIDVEITIPSEDFKIDADSKEAGLAFSLYIASKEEVEASEEEGTINMDAGTYVSSEYVQTAVAVRDLEKAYVLYNEKAEKEYQEYPSGSDLVNEVNSYERAWSYSAADPNDRYVYLYGDNTLSTAEDQTDKGAYTIHIKVDDEYLTLDEAAARFRTDVADITPEYSATVKYFDKEGTEDENLAENYSVNVRVDENVTEEEPYGTSIDMAKTNELAPLAGMYVQVENTFAFPEDNKYGYTDPVISNVGKYTVINEPVKVKLAAASTDWTYDFALAHADDPANPTEANVQPIVYSDLAFTVEKLGGIPLANILLHSGPISNESYVIVDGQKVAYTDANAPKLSFKALNVDDTYEAGIATVEMSKGYKFATDQDTKYEFVYKYNISQFNTVCEVVFEVTLGQMPGSQSIEYTFDENDKIKFMLPGSGEVDYIGTERNVTDGFAKMYSEKVASDEHKWFGNETLTPEGQFKAALMVDDVNRTFYTTKRDGEILNNYEHAKHDVANGRPVWTRLNIPEVENESPANSTSYIRVSSSDITAIGNEFEFTTEIETWFGPVYTFTAKLGVDKPAYELGYINTHINFEDADIPFVELGYNEVNGEYVIQESHPKNYFNVTNIPAGSTDVLKVKFTTDVPAGDPSYGTAPVIPDLNVNEAGELGEHIITWSNYNARDLKLRATLVASSAEGASEVIINYLDLAIVVPQLVTDLVPKAETAIVERSNTGVAVEINLWEYLEAIANENYPEGNGGKNFIPDTEDVDPAVSGGKVVLSDINNSDAMKLYGAEISFGEISIVSGGQMRPDLQDATHYNAANGTFTYFPEDGTIVSPIEISVEVTLNYYLDYNGNTDPDANGAHTTTLKLTIKDK